jgi:predicted O-methyltransferase YrrM
LYRLLGKFAGEVSNPSDALYFVSRVIVPPDPQVRERHSWLWGRQPRRQLTEVFPGIQTQDIQVCCAFDRSPSISVELEELACLLAIVRHVRAQRILEIGTFDGNTALNIAVNTREDALIVTVDLPPDWDEKLALKVPERYRNVTSRAHVGRQFSGRPEANKIVQVYCDSAKLDWSRLPVPFDVVFIDGCHHRAYVENDTANAFRHVRPGGLILWHDYGYKKDVIDVVDETARRTKVCALSGTRLAVGFVPDAGLLE